MTMNWLDYHSIIILGYKCGLESHLESKRPNTLKCVGISLKPNPLKTKTHANLLKKKVPTTLKSINLKYSSFLPLLKNTLLTLFLLENGLSFKYIFNILHL